MARKVPYSQAPPCDLEAIRTEVLAREKEARSELLPIAEVTRKRWWRGKPSQVDT